MSYKVYRPNPTRGYRGKPKYFPTRKKAVAFLKRMYPTLEDAYELGWAIEEV